MTEILSLLLIKAIMLGSFLAAVLFVANRFLDNKINVVKWSVVCGLCAASLHTYIRLQGSDDLLRFHYYHDALNSCRPGFIDFQANRVSVEFCEENNLIQLNDGSHQLNCEYQQPQNDSMQFRVTRTAYTVDFSLGRDGENFRGIRGHFEKSDCLAEAAQY
jgi:hypothetical protein